MKIYELIFATNRNNKRTIPDRSENNAEVDTTLPHNVAGEQIRYPLQR